jgi:peptide deformylase
MLRITQYGESILHKKGKQVDTFDADLADLSLDMIETMYAADGIGLAAQQIDQAIMMCVVDVNPGSGVVPSFDYELDGKRPPIDLIMPMVLVNPIIREVSDEKDIYEEGCLSFPQIHGDVKRPIGIKVEFQDVDGNPHRLSCDGIFARCIQHEVDHLNGILYIDRMDKKTLSAIKSEIEKLKATTQKSNG